MKALNQKKLREVGFISKSFGYKGELVLIAETMPLGKVMKEKFLFIRLEGLPVPFSVESIREKSGNLLVKFLDVDDETAARRLIQMKVSVESSGKEEAAEWSWHDVVGYEAEDTAYGPLGKIIEVQEFPMQMIAKCEVNGKEVLFPLNETVVIGIDESRQHLLLDLPEGLLDIYLGQS
jgi:16S rRNA processing protein RimM